MLDRSPAQLYALATGAVTPFAAGCARPDTELIATTSSVAARTAEARSTAYFTAVFMSV